MIAKKGLSLSALLLISLQIFNASSFEIPGANSFILVDGIEVQIFPSFEVTYEVFNLTSNGLVAYNFTSYIRVSSELSKIRNDSEYMVDGTYYSSETLIDYNSSSSYVYELTDASCSINTIDSSALSPQDQYQLYFNTMDY